MAEIQNQVLLNYQSTYAPTLRPIIRTIGLLAFFCGVAQAICAVTKALPLASGTMGMTNGYMPTEIWFGFVALAACVNTMEIVAGLMAMQRLPRGRRWMIAWAWAAILVQGTNLSYNAYGIWETYQRNHVFWGIQGTALQYLMPRLVEDGQQFVLWNIFPLLVLLMFSRHEFRGAFEDYARAG